MFFSLFFFFILCSFIKYFGSQLWLRCEPPRNMPLETVQTCFFIILWYSVGQGQIGSVRLGPVQVTCRLQPQGNATGTKTTGLKKKKKKVLSIKHKIRHSESKNLSDFEIRNSLTPFSRELQQPLDSSHSKLLTRLGSHMLPCLRLYFYFSMY